MSLVEVQEGIDKGLPWHYGSPLNEQRALVDGLAAVLLDNREIFTIGGSDRTTWLQNLTSQDVQMPAAAGGQPVLILDANGHVQHWFYCIDDGQQYYCITNPGKGEELIAWLESMKFWSQVQITRSSARLIWWGNKLADPKMLASAPSAIGDGLLALVNELPQDDRMVLAGTWAYDALRIEAGIVRIGIDSDEKTIPNEIGLYGTALDKGCYPGQEAVARIHNLGRPPRRLVRLLFDGQLAKAGTDIEYAGKIVGRLTSAAEHFELGPIGLAMVKRSVPKDAVFKLENVEANQEILVDPEVGEHFRFRS